jgi:hypothetical protein
MVGRQGAIEHESRQCRRRKNGSLHRLFLQLGPMPVDGAGSTILQIATTSAAIGFLRDGRAIVAPTMTGQICSQS